MVDLFRSQFELADFYYINDEPLIFNMSKPSLFSLIVLTIAVSCSNQENKVHSGEATTESLRPNILWLVAEDLSCYLPSFGDSTIQTPNLSRLAEEGICYDQFYTAAPVCAPARASIAMGMYPTSIAAGHMRTGGNVKFYPKDITPYEALPPVGTRMMSEWLRINGYYCTNNSKEDYQFKKTPTAWDESSKQAHWRNRQPGQPFFSIFNFTVCHESQIWAKAEDSLLVDADLEVPDIPYLPRTDVALNDIRRMYSNIIEMDRQVGRVLDQLEEDGELENTIIFWYSDHGGPLPRQKRLLYDSGMKVPMIIRFPDKKGANTRNDDLTCFIDLAPTVLSLAGIPPPSYMQGIDFLGDHQPTQKRKYVFGAGDRFDAQYDCIRAARDKRYKLIRYYDTEKPMFLPVAYRDQMPIMQELHRLRDLGQLTPAQALWFRPTKPNIEFFDVDNDPHEINNLADDPQYSDKIDELSKAMDQWLIDIDDQGLQEEKELLKKLWPDGSQPVTANPSLNLSKDQIQITCATEGASIGVKLWNDENEEPSSWKVYTDPIHVGNKDLKIKYVAHRIGFKPSAENLHLKE